MNIVIGGASGIGAATVPLLSGPTLVADRVGGDVACDLADRSSLEALAAGIDKLDALVVTAGVSPVQADARTVFDIDLAGMARVLDVFDRLVGRGTVVVCLSSMAAHIGGEHVSAEQLAAIDDPLGDAIFGLTDNPGFAYLMSKLGVQRMVRRKAVEWGPRGARCVSVSPGVIDTPMGALEMATEGSGAADVAKLAVLGRTGVAEDIARVVAFLCSSDAAFITGTDILVDGGVIAALRTNTTTDNEGKQR
ncbi:MAG: pldh-t 3 [Ilumatobacteraceae bacterium]|nr:pldh-t 3 [Ilumatobacteraceae bacterium]